MELRHFGENSPEFINNQFAIIMPAAEALLNPSAADAWPGEVTNNETFKNQTEKRRELIGSVDDIVSRMPDPSLSIEEAVRSEQITEEQAENLYRNLSATLNDADYQRLLLYLPFEFLPDKSWRPKSEYLRQAIGEFVSIYQNAWRRLLSTQDVRANFVDGDVIEVEQRSEDLPRVVKAAHLLPKLIERGLIDINEAIQLYRQNDDEVFKSSIADALFVSADMGMIPDEVLFELKESNDETLVAIADAAQLNHHAESEPTEEFNLEDIEQIIASKVEEIDGRDHPGLTEKRKQWISESEMQKTINDLGEQVAKGINNGRFSAEDIARHIESGSNSRDVMVEAIRIAVESKALSSKEEALSQYENFKEILYIIYYADSSEAKQLGVKTFRRLNSLGIIDANELDQLGVAAPRLDRPTSENIKLIDSKLKRIGEQVISSAENAETASAVYPVALVFGSRIKGYGEPDSDLDTAIFMRPGVSYDQSIVAEKILPDSKIFWLRDEDGKLVIDDTMASSPSSGSSDWTHVLFGGVWVGDQSATKELHAKLLTGYLQENDVRKRGRWLEEMEKDMLQYRLMHKGYERFAAPAGGVHTAHSDKIDGRSIYWDSGYRRLATQLYTKKVFMPNMPE